MAESLYMPNMTRHYIISQKPENHPTNNERVWQNEILGEFYNGDSSPLAIEDIEKNLTDDDRKRFFARQITINENKRVYFGCDWGQKVDSNQSSEEDDERMAGVGKSYSCGVILTVEGPHLLHVQYAKMLAKRTLEYKTQFVDEVFRKYSVNLAVGDIGDAGDLTEILQQKYGTRFLASRAVGQLISKIKFVNEHIPHSGEIQFERNYYIGELFNALRDGKIRFPYGDFEKISWLLQHCCSMETKTSIDKFGDIKTSYVKGVTPNDGLMALLNAWLAYKFDITNGFKIKDPNLFNQMPAVNKGIPAVLGYLNKMNPFKR